VIHILIGLAVATVLIILWASGNLFACVFLSIPPALGLLIFMLQDARGSPNHWVWALACAFSLAGIWAPRLFRRPRVAGRPSGFEATAGQTGRVDLDWVAKSSPGRPVLFLPND
jgi:hypothetical protein